MRRFIFMLILSGMTLVGFAQETKLGAGAQLVLDNYKNGTYNLKKEDLSFEKGKTITLQSQSDINDTSKKTVTKEFVLGKKNNSTMAVPYSDSKGIMMVDGWIRLSKNDYAEIEALGVEITAKFDGFVAAKIPVENLEKLASLTNVIEIDVAKMMNVNTNKARIKTNVDDVIGFTKDAQMAGLLQAYDGTGVVLGVIDTGIQFNHQMFKDENGNTRIKKAYVYSNGQLRSYTSESQINNLTYDYTSENHGTHTSSIAGGSDIKDVAYYDGSSFSRVTLGGMAPGTDLVLCGLAGQLYDTYIAQCIQGITEYASSVNKPCVISLSLGSQRGPHDGTGYMADVCRQYTGEGKIILFSSSNDAEEDIYVSSNASSSNPLRSVFDLISLDGYTSGSNIYYNYFLDGECYTYARKANQEIAAVVYVIDTSNNTIKWVSNPITSTTTIRSTTSGSSGGTFGSYFGSATSGGGTITLTRSKDSYSNKYYFNTSITYLSTKSASTSTSTDDDGNTYTIYTGNYKIGLAFYPTSGNCYIDSWINSYDGNYVSATAKLNGTTYQFIEGSNLSSASNDSYLPNVIPVGAYTAGATWCASDGYGYNASRYYPVDEVASFSSYQAEGFGPTESNIPWISAPGVFVQAGYNYGYFSNSSYDAENEAYNYIYEYGDGVASPMGVLSGTSMATPCAAGIVALWLQADPTLTPERVKEVMKETAIHDSYTDANFSKTINGSTYSSAGKDPRFGNGKIDALAGIQYILGVSGGPAISVAPESVSMTGVVGQTYTETVTVTGINLEGNVNVSVDKEAFSVSSATISVEDATAGATVTITWTPTAEGTTTATLTFSSDNAVSVEVPITAKAEVPEIFAEPEELTFNCLVGETATQTFEILAANLLEDVTLTLEDADGVFSLDKTTISKADAEEIAEVTVTFSPTVVGNYTGTVTVSSSGAEPVTISLSASTPRSIDVTISSYGVSTLYLDYPVAIPNDPNLLAVYYAYQVSENEVKLARLRGFIPANTGVVVQGNSGTYTFMETSASVQGLTRKNYLHGTVAKGGITPAQALADAQASANAIVMTLGYSDKNGTSNGYVGFYRYTGKNLAAYKAFLIYDPDEFNGSSVNALSIGGMGGEFTGIHEVDAAQNGGAWYTPQGVRLNGTPKQRGLYIRDGKTVVVK